MNNLLKPVIPFFTMLIFSACGNIPGIKNDSSVNNLQDLKTQESSALPDNPVLNNDMLNAVYTQYIQLTTALAKNDEAGAKIAAIAIEAGAKNIREGNRIISYSSQITNAQDIESQRAAFAGMSRSIIGLINKEGLSNGEVYIVFCPMAFDNKGAEWISNTKTIHNPYFGEKMISCGEIKQTINPATQTQKN